MTIKDVFSMTCGDCDHGLSHSQHVEGRLYCAGCETQFTPADVSAAVARYGRGEQTPYDQLQICQVPIQELLKNSRTISAREL